MSATSAARKPRLAVVIGHFSTLAERLKWRDLDPQFNPAGMFDEVHIIAIGDDHAYERLEFGTVRVHPIASRVRTPGLRRINDALTLVAGTRKLAAVCDQRGIDLIAQTYGTPLKFGVPAVWQAGRRDLPSVITLCSDYEEALPRTYSRSARWAAEFVWKWLFDRCTRIRSKSNHIAGFAYRRGVPPAKVTAIPNKADVDRFGTRPTEDELEKGAAAFGLSDRGHAAVFFTSARLLAAKNLPRMIEAYARIPESTRAAFLIAGEGPQRAELEDLAVRLNVADQVRFLGYLGPDDLKLAYHLSDVFVFPTLYEGQPRAVTEAMLAGLPIICANRGSVCEMVADGTDGLWVEPENIDAIAAAMTRLAVDEELRRTCGRHVGFEPSDYGPGEINAREASLFAEAIEDHGRS